MTDPRRKHLLVQAARRCCQVAVIGLIAGLSFLALYGHYRAARALDDDQLMSGLRGAVLTAVDRWVSTANRPEERLDDYRGNIWSLRLAGVEITDPLAVVEATAASRSWHGPLWLALLIPVLLTLLLGRVFCSWICPGGLLFEVTGKLRHLLRLAELPPPELRFSHRTKYLLLGVGLAGAALLGAPMFALVYPPAVISRVIHAWIFGTALTGMLVLLLAIIAAELFVAPRWWCRSLCPGGALYGLLGRFRLLRVRLDASRCSGCKLCAPVCEPGLNPVRQSSGMECDNCGVCIRHCPDGALAFTVGGWRRAPRERCKSGAAVGESGLRRVTRSGGATTVRRAVLVALLLVPPPLWAHHILGLPHYSYKDNYPQAPTLEYPARSGPLDIVLTSYPGKPAVGEPAYLTFYVKNRVTDAPFGKPVSVRVLQTATFGESTTVLPTTTIPPIETPYQVNVVFPEDGEYVVELSLDVEGKREVIPFAMVAGRPTAAASILIAVGAGLALFVIVVRAVKIKRARRLRLTAQTA